MYKCVVYLKGTSQTDRVSGGCCHGDGDHLALSAAVLLCYTWPFSAIIPLLFSQRCIIAVPWSSYSEQRCREFIRAVYCAVVNAPRWRPRVLVSCCELLMLWCVMNSMHFNLPQRARPSQTVLKYFNHLKFLFYMQRTTVDSWLNKRSVLVIIIKYIWFLKMPGCNFLCRSHVFIVLPCKVLVVYMS